MIACERPSKELPAMLVFQESIRYLKDNLLETLRTKHSSWYADKKPRGQENAHDLVYEDDIHWVITVPAIWEDAAKQFMRETAINVWLLTMCYHLFPIIIIIINNYSDKTNNNINKIRNK